MNCRRARLLAVDRVRSRPSGGARFRRATVVGGLVGLWWLVGAAGALAGPTPMFSPAAGSPYLTGA
jgi:hypothetical protein